ncbi:MAG: filamentous hemagglutinin N-terminal domain-containing protein [Nitrospira sp. CR1.3]|nr:filamentous hemagglutinin N-terminal domain-containing protein [Nitrospira sp. CR1.3]
MREPVVKSMTTALACSQIALASAPVWSSVVLCAALTALPAAAAVLPENPTVVSGAAAFESTPTSLTVQQSSARAIINWQSFSIAQGHLTEFIQPSANAIALNRVVGVNGVIPQSLIDGTLKANGIVMLLNQNGILFGGGAQVNVGGLAASSLHMTDTDFLAGSFKLTQMVKDGVAQSVGDIRNAGSITAGMQGVYLFAPNVENSGVITSPNGSIVLAAGTTAYLSNRPDGRGFLFELQAPAGKSVNLRELKADGGQITMAGLVVNQQGLAQANTVQTSKGRIELIAKQPAAAPASSPLAALTTSAGSVTKADGGSISVQGQSITHQGEMQANGGSVEMTSIAGTQAGSGVLTTSAGSRIASDGGHVQLEGKAIDHGGIVQSNAGSARNGHVALLGKDRMTFRSTSRTSSKGSAVGITDGGTIIGMASGQNGEVSVESGAVIDLSPAAGGQGGELWLGDRRQSLPLIGIGAVTGASQTKLIPIDQTVATLPTTAAKRDASFVALSDIRVSGLYDLTSLAPGAQSGSLRLFAGRDLIFDNATIQNDPFNFGLSPRDIIGVAGGNVQLSNSTLVSGGGGHVSLAARGGNISLLDPSTGALSSIRVKGGGNLSLDAQRDVVTTVRVDPDASGLVDGFALDSNLQGIVIDGTKTTAADGTRSGNGLLTIKAREGDLVGGQLLGTPRGPGFVVRNADAEVLVGGTVGKTNLPLDANGLLPDGTIMTAQKLTEDVRGYVDVAMTDAHVSISAQGNVYLRRARDSGLLFEPLTGGDSASPYDIGRHGFPAEAVGNSPQFSNGFQHNRLTVTSHHGNVSINADRISSEAGQTELVDAGTYFPSTTDIRAPLGTIQLRSAMNFFNGPKASITFFAGRHIEGLVKFGLAPPSSDLVFWVYTGADLNPANWRVVDFRKPVPPELLRWVGVEPPEGAMGLRPVTLPAEYLESVPSSVPLIALTQQNPEALIGLDPRVNNNITLLNSRPGTPDPASPPGKIELAAGQGDIKNLTLNFLDPTYVKETLVRAGGNIEKVALKATAAPLGMETRTITEQVPLLRDAQTGLLRPPKKDEVIAAGDVVVKQVTLTVNVPKPAVIMEAGGTIDLSKSVTLAGSNPPASGVLVVGDGTVHITAGKNLNLGDSSGIFMRPGVTASGLRRGGLLDIAVGQDLLMTQSRIVTDGGAGIAIHGIDTSYIPGYDNSALHPVEIPESLRGPVNVSYTGGLVDVGATTRRILGEESTGIQVRGGGSVGVRATTPVVNQDGSVTVTLERDPTAVKITTAGDVNVNTSRIATFSGGDIVITSRDGSINAGSGGKNEQQLFPLDIPVLDAAGRPMLKPNGEPETRRENFLVPGSGIFTYHPLDPTVLNFPKYDTPAMTALKGEIRKQGFLGRDTTGLEQQFEALNKARAVEFDPIFEEFIARNPDKPEIINGQPTGRFLPLELGDVSLNAGLDILVPPAGIRGKRVDLVAGRTLDFQGGEVQGKVRFKATNLTGDVKVAGTFAGSSSGGGTVSVANSGGGGSVGGLSGVTGGVAATSASTSGSVSTAQKASEAVQETATAATSQQAEAKAKQLAAKDDEKGKSSKVAQSIKMKHGVIIQVDVKPRAGG